MSERGMHPQEIIYDPDLRGTWMGPPGRPAVPYDIGGVEDGVYRPGTTFLEDGPLIEVGGLGHTVQPSRRVLGAHALEAYVESTAEGQD